MHLRYIDKEKLNGKEWKTICHVSSKSKKPGVEKGNLIWLY